MAEQLDFFFVAEAEQVKKDAKRLEYEQAHRDSWRYCWGWSGPVVGEPCDIHSCSVKLAEPLAGKDWYNSKFAGSSIYAYMERCILLEELPGGIWLAEIAMGIVHGQPWYKDGTKVLLSITDIWPPTRDLRAQRQSAADAA